MNIIKNFFKSGVKCRHDLKLGGFNIFKHKPLPASRYNCSELKDTDQLRKDNSNPSYILGSNLYVKNIIKTSSLYRDIQFSESLIRENAESKNELVVVLRNLDKNEVSANAIEEFVLNKCEKISFTVLDLIEVFHILQKPRILSELEKQDHIWKILSDKCFSIVGERSTSKLLILMFLISEIEKPIPYILPFIVLHRYRKLTKAELVCLFYFLKFRRVSIKPEARFSFWQHVAEVLKEMNMDEMTVVAHGSFRSEFRMSKKVGQIMLTRMEENIENLNQYQAGEISKYIKFIGHKWDSQLVLRLQEKVMSVSDRFSITTLTHLASIRNNENSVNYGLFDILRDRLINEKNPRMKEVERFLLLRLHECTEIEDPEFLNFVTEKVLRNDEQIFRYPRSFLSLMNYLVYRNIYLEDLIDYIFSAKFLNILYEEIPDYNGYELSSIDCSVELERPDYRGNRLPAIERNNYLKKNHYKILKGFIHGYNRQIAVLLNKILGSEYAVLINGLPHLPSFHPAIRLSKDYEPVKIEEVQLKSRIGELVKFQEDTWIIFLFITGRYQPDGTNVNLFTQTKLRQLRAVGFITVEINKDIETWKEMTGETQKEYLCGRIVEALNTKPPIFDRWLVQNQSSGLNC